MKSAPPVTSTNARATSAVTRTRRRVRLPPPAVPRPPSLSADATLVNDCWRAGARPTRRPVIRVSTAAAAKTAASTRTSFSRGASAGARATSASTPHMPSSRPATPPAAAMTRLSVASCRTIRPRLAPSAMRVASSRRRPDARASSRLAMLAQAMSSTKVTAPASATSAGRICPVTRSARGWTRNPVRALASGCSISSCAARAVAAPCAWASPVPGARRATVRRKTAPRTGLARSRPSGRQTSASASTTGRNAGGSTPMISCGSPASTTRRPTAAASPPKRRCQRPSLMRATRRAFGRSSADVKSRPRTGLTPSTARYSCDTCSPASASGSVSPVRVGPQPPMAATRSTAGRLVLQSTKLPGEAHSSAGPPARRRSCHSITRRSASGYGSGRRTTALSTVNTAVLAPMPSASVRIATAANPGARASARSA